MTPRFDDRPRVYSYGAGVQSTAMLALVGTGHLPPGVFVFSNVGDDSEHPASLRYLREVAFEYAGDHGIEMIETGRVPRRGPHKGKPQTLYGTLMAPGSRSLPIPVRMPDTGAPGTRSCTADYKIRVVQNFVKARGATAATPWRTAIGISTDEYERATSRKTEPYEELEYPLLTLEHRLAPRGASRDQCAQIIADAGLPVPPKSSCYFCPFHRPDVWNDQARDEPELFKKSCHLEETLNLRRATLPCTAGAGRWPVEATQGRTGDDDEGTAQEATYRTDYTPDADGLGACPSCRSRQALELGPAGEWIVAPHMKGPVYLTRFGKPLRSIFGDRQQLSLLAPGWNEDEGYRCGDVCDT